MEITDIFRFMTMQYGQRFVDQWSMVEMAELMRFWSDSLRGYTNEEITRGLSTLGAWPPTLPEFLKLCRPPIDPVAAYNEACSGIAARAAGREFDWSSPAIFWAASAMSFDLRSKSYWQNRAQWEATLRREIECNTWPDIPPPLIALPAPQHENAPPGTGARLLAHIRANMGRIQIDDE